VKTGLQRGAAISGLSTSAVDYESANVTATNTDLADRELPSVAYQESSATLPGSSSLHSVQPGRGIHLVRTSTVHHCLPPDDDRMMETCCGNNIGRGEELLR
jgi:hypothetical protein